MWAIGFGQMHKHKYASTQIQIHKYANTDLCVQWASEGNAGGSGLKVTQLFINVHNFSLSLKFISTNGQSYCSLSRELNAAGYQENREGGAKTIPTQAEAHTRPASPSSATWRRLPSFSQLIWTRRLNFSTSLACHPSTNIYTIYNTHTMPPFQQVQRR